MNKIKKTLISGITTLSMCTMMFGDMTPVMAAGYGGGNGTEDDPYIISTADHLTELATNVDGGNEYENTYFKMNSDISLSGEWNSIGNTYYDFQGIFDGDNHRIDGLNLDGNDGQGLFLTNYGTIKNLNVQGNIQVDDFHGQIGGIAACNTGGIIENCSFDGSITLNVRDFTKLDPVGGIAGENLENGTIKNCYNAATITEIHSEEANAGEVGGIVGHLVNSSITDCYNAGSLAITGNTQYSYLGGIAGYTLGGVITNCFNTDTSILSVENQENNQFISVGPISGNDDYNGENCYYLVPSAASQAYTTEPEMADYGNTVTIFSDSGPIGKTAEQFASGEVTYLLNNSTSVGNLAWYQTLNADSLPSLDSTHEVVYYSDTGGYSNSPTESPPQPTAQPTGKRKLYVDFMGTGDTPLNESPATWERFKAGDENDNDRKKFWIGVAVDKVHDLNLFTDGVYSLEIAFEYNPYYVQPYYPDGSTDYETDWHDTLIAGNFSTANDSLNWNSSQYTITSVRETDIDVYNDRDGLTLAEQRKSDNWKMCTVLVTFKEDEPVTNARFSGLTSEDKQYLLKFPFVLKNTPAAGEDPNPTVLSLVRGPETLNIGSDEKGINPYSAWEATVTDPNDTTNMKTLFSFGGDIKLFGENETSSINDIIPVKPKTGEETEDTEYKLSKSPDTLLKEGFDPTDTDTLDYYLSVPNETDTLRLKIDASEEPTVIGNNVNLATTLDGMYYMTEPFDVLELNKDPTTGGTADGFNNIVTVELGDTTYTIHIRRLLKPRIELNPGNSPYGLIERMGEKYYKGTGTPWTDEQVAAVKEDLYKEFTDKSAMYKFHNTVTTSDNKVFDAFPDGADADIKYTPSAWGDEANMDKDVDALFIYQYTKFKEPGIYNVIDENGDNIDLTDSDVTISITAENIYRFNNLNDLTDVTLEESTELSKDNDGYIEDLTANSKKPIRPDIYSLKYTIKRTGKEDITATRNLILLPKRGDTDFDNVISSADVKTMKEWYQEISQTKLDIFSDRIKNICFYRAYDTDFDGVVSSADTKSDREIYQEIREEFPLIYKGF